MSADHEDRVQHCANAVEDVPRRWSKARKARRVRVEVREVGIGISPQLAELNDRRPGWLQTGANLSDLAYAGTTIRILEHAAADQDTRLWATPLADPS